ncbi:hypothetical protein LWI29_031451 [Acer saccharum]|uniref:CCHC-type domain-containing protein n=1 Tax=Acer saccharum TaxID=4024 RepID=A0AA39VG72_ACESA|nr:hypothetical protein LWI29_031451 [Acer saccharum]
MSSREKIQCYECGGFGHISKDCANLEDEREEVATSSESDEEVVAKFLALGCSHKQDNKVKVCEGSSSSLNDCENNYFAFPISYNEEENESQEESDSSEDDSSSNSTNGYVKKKVLDEYRTEFKSLAMKTKEKIQRLREENLDLLAHVDHLSEQVDRSKNIEDKLRKELDLSKRNEEDLKRELEEAKGPRTRIVSSTEKLDHMLGVGKSPCDKRGLGFEDGKESSTPNKTVFVKSLSYKEASPVQIPRKKIDLGQCSHSAQVKVVPRRQPQAQPTRVPHANFPQIQLHQGKRPIMQTQPRKQPSLGQQQRRRDPIQQPRQPQRHGKAPMHAHGHGMIPNFVPTCHFCGVNGHIRPKCFRYIKMCRVKSMIEKKKARASMHAHRKEEIHLHNPMTSRSLEPLTTRKKNVISMWIRKNEPACYETNKSQIGSSKSNGLGRSIGPHDLQ